MIKKKLIIAYMILLLLILPSCDWGLEVVGIELVEYPDRLYYVSGIDSELDLSGGKIDIKTKDKVTREPCDMSSSEVDVSHDIDFGIPGIYEVTISRWKYSVVFPIQVIDIEELKSIVQ